MNIRFYFSHDYNARSDPRLRNILMKIGVEGIGIYWCIIEMLYEQDGKIDLSNIDSIAFELHTECERIKDILSNYDLFKFKDAYFYSESVLKRLRVRKEKSNMARQSALTRWNKDKYSDANAMRTQCDSNAIKGKEKKVNNIKENNRSIIFQKPLLTEVETYCKERKNNVDAKRWYDFYEAKGWMIGKNKMKDWRAAVRTWESKEDTIVPQFSSGPGR